MYVGWWDTTEVDLLASRPIATTTTITTTATTTTTTTTPTTTAATTIATGSYASSASDMSLASNSSTYVHS